MKKTFILFLISINAIAQINVQQLANGGLMITPKGIATYSKPLLGNDTTNVALGMNALKENDSNRYNIAIGKSALQNLKSPNGYGLLNTNNLAIGNEALMNISGSSWNNGINNLAIGNMSLRENAVGTNNVAIGQYSQNHNLESNNTSIGAFSMAGFNNSGTSNTAIGVFSASYLIGNENVAIGNSSLYAVLGNNNTAIGANSGLNVGNGSRNTFVGYESGAGYFIPMEPQSVSPDSANVFIGYKSGKYESGSNKLYIANSETLNPLIWGDFNLGKLNFNGNVGIGTNDPQTKLQVNDGAIRLFNSFDNKSWDWNYDVSGDYAFFDEFGVSRKLYIPTGQNTRLGIGIIPAQYTNLHVKSIYTDALMQLEGNSTPSGTGLSLGSNQYDSFIKQGNSNGKFRLKHGNNDVITIWSDSRVALNMQTPPPFALGNSLEVYDPLSSNSSSVLISTQTWATGAYAVLGLGDSNHQIKAIHGSGMEIKDINKIKLVGGNVGIGTANPDAKLLVDGYTKLGSDAPAIKLKKLTTTTGSDDGANGKVVISTGVTASKIIGIQILVEYSSGQYVPNSYKKNGGYEFNFATNNLNEIELYNIGGNSFNIYSKTTKILITYEE